MMTQGRIQPDEMCVGAMYKQFRQVQLSTSLCELANIFDRYYAHSDGLSCVSLLSPALCISIVWLMLSGSDVRTTVPRPDYRDYYALVVAEQKCFQKGKHTTRSVVAGVVTRIDLLNFIAKVCPAPICTPLL